MLHQGRYVCYFRVSTDKQGKSGLGLEGQHETVRQHLNGGSWEIVGEFTEVETATRKVKHRPELERALAHCRIMNARLIVAAVSRLTRDPDFMSKLATANVEVEFCDIPNLPGPVGTFVLRQMLAVAELEAGMIAERTKKALAAAKARGQKLGGDRGNLPAVQREGHLAGLAVRQERAAQRAKDLRPTLTEMWKGGAESYGSIAKQLTDRGIPTARGKTGWSAMQVKRLIDRLAVH